MHLVKESKLRPRKHWKDERCSFLKQQTHRIQRKAWKQQINAELFELEGDIPLTEAELLEQRELKAELDRYYEDLFWEDEEASSENELCSMTEEEYRAMEEAYRQMDLDLAEERALFDSLTKENPSGS